MATEMKQTVIFNITVTIWGDGDIKYFTRNLFHNISFDIAWLHIHKKKKKNSTKADIKISDVL